MSKVCTEISHTKSDNFLQELQKDGERKARVNNTVIKLSLCVPHIVKILQHYKIPHETSDMDRRAVDAVQQPTIQKPATKHQACVCFSDLLLTIGDVRRSLIAC